jgi:hypothetical protein
MTTSVFFPKRPIVLFVLLLTFLSVDHAAHGQTTPVTRQETLRGSITPEREWWNVQHYDLAV